jgi:DNA processing protein
MTPELASNRSLAERIVESGGVLLSEVPPQVRPEPRTLVQRDRIQAALAEAVVVAQTGIPDGTLHTVRFAIEQGRALIVPRPSSP